VLALTGGHGSDVHADTTVTFMAVEVADAMLEAAKEQGCAGRVAGPPFNVHLNPL